MVQEQMSLFCKLTWRSDWRVGIDCAKSEPRNKEADRKRKEKDTMMAEAEEARVIENRERMLDRSHAPNSQ